MKFVDTKGHAGYDPKRRFKVVEDKPLTHYDRVVGQTPYDFADWLAAILNYHSAFAVSDRLDCPHECPLYNCCCDQASDNIEDWLNAPADKE